jgi:hypothetical protein
MKVFLTFSVLRGRGSMSTIFFFPSQSPLFSFLNLTSIPADRIRKRLETWVNRVLKSSIIFIKS